MARNGKLTAPVDGWVDLTDGNSQWLLVEVLESTPAQCPGAWVRFQAGNPGAQVIEGHILRRGAGNLELGAQMDMLGGRAWARSISAEYPAELFVTSVDAA